MTLGALASHAGAVVVGAAVALSSVAVHRTVVLRLPLGLALAVATSLVVVLALRQSPRRRVVTSYAAGWLVAFGLVVVGRPEGDFVVVSDLSGYLLMAVALLLVVAGVASIPVRGPGHRAAAPRIPPRE